jgi:hypothetical protein
MTLNYSFPSLLLISLPTSYTYKLQLTLSATGCLQISFHSIKLKLSFSSLVYLLSSQKSRIPLFSCLLMYPSSQPTQLKIWGSFLIQPSQCLIISLLCRSLVSLLSVTFGELETLLTTQLPTLLPHLSFTQNSTTVTLCF